MKTYTKLFAWIAGAIGIIGIGESVANFSLFQTMISVGLVWLAFAMVNNVNESLENGEENS
ncbi:MAG: hypothetical protein IIW11_07300 [Bacteroidales bacterium]|jgi:hypothetical protein|nr:hypothetical protein [Bacteroidales bacterium]